MARCQINHRKSTRTWRFHKTTGGGPGALFFSSPMPEPEEGPSRTPIGGHLPNCGRLERNTAGGMAPQPVRERSVNLANERGNTGPQNTRNSNSLCHGDERPPLPAICGRSWWLVFELLKGHLCLQDSAITWRLLAWHPIPVHVVPQRCFWGRSSDSSCPRHTVTIP